MADPWILDLGMTGVGDAPLVGGKAANLGELTSGGFPVPPGFAVTAAAYLDAMEQGGVRDQLRSLVAGLDRDDAEAVRRAAEVARTLVRQTGLPSEIRVAALDAVGRLGHGARLAVFSSATAEDAADTSFAGMHESFTNVYGDDEILDRLVACWLSAFSDRVVSYRAAQGLLSEPAIAVVVQRMVDADSSGVMFSVDPASGDRTHIVIKGAFGLGEVVVGDEVEPDEYRVSKDRLVLTSMRVGHKQVAVRRGSDDRAGPEPRSSASCSRVLVRRPRTCTA